jgi:hypothetical protein
VVDVGVERGTTVGPALQGVQPIWMNARLPEFDSDDDCVDEGIVTNSTVTVNIGGVETTVKGFPLSLPVASMDVSRSIAIK